MKKILVVLSILLLTIPAFGGEVYVIKFKNTDEGIVNKGVTVVEGGGKKTGWGNYSLEVLSDDKKTLETKRFYVPNIGLTDYLNGSGGVIKLSNNSFGVIVPYKGEGTKIKVYEKDVWVETIDISQFSEAETQNIKPGEETQQESFLWISIIIGLLVAIISIFFLLKKQYPQKLPWS